MSELLIGLQTSELEKERQHGQGRQNFQRAAATILPASSASGHDEAPASFPRLHYTSAYLSSYPKSGRIKGNFEDGRIPRWGLEPPQMAKSKHRALGEPCTWLSAPSPSHLRPAVGHGPKPTCTTKVSLHFTTPSSSAR